MFTTTLTIAMIALSSEPIATSPHLNIKAEIPNNSNDVNFILTDYKVWEKKHG